MHPLRCFPLSLSFLLSLCRLVAGAHAFAFCSFLGYNANASSKLLPLLLPRSRSLLLDFYLYLGIGGDGGGDSLVTQTPVSMGYTYMYISSCVSRFVPPIVSSTSLSFSLRFSRSLLVFLQSLCVHVGRCCCCCRCCCPSHGHGSDRMSAIGHKG